MIFPGVLSGFLSAIIVILGFFYGLRERQIYRNLWSFFTFTFFLCWALLSWLHPSGLNTSVSAGAWIPSMLIAIVVSLLLEGLLPATVVSSKPSKTMRWIYWLGFIIMGLAVILRYSVDNSPFN